METDGERFFSRNLAHEVTIKAQELSDLELALLLCLLTHEHCIIEAEANQIDKAEQDLISACSNIFGLSSALLTCSGATSVDDFGAGVLLADEDPDDTPFEAGGAQKDFFLTSNNSRRRSNATAIADAAQVRVADVVITRNLHLAVPQVQIQALELMRSKRIYTRTAIRTAPKQFLLVALVPVQAPRFVPHLTDHFLLSHLYDAEADEESANLCRDDESSTGSVIRSPSCNPGFARGTSHSSHMKPSISKTDLDAWILLTSKVKLSPDVRAYLHNIVVFMRMHRAVASGVTPQATRHIYALSYALAPLHGLDFITPSLVALAVRKVYPHRLTIVKPEDEISLQWGSSLHAVTIYLEGLHVEDIVEDVLETVETPL